MTARRRSGRRIPRAMLYAAVGGLVAMPLTVAYNWHTGVESEFEMGLVVVGGMIAGFLANRDSTDGAKAGFGAGVIGALAGYAWMLPGILSTASDFGAAWSFPPATVVLAALFSAVVFGISGVVGLVGGVVGGWLAELVATRRSPTTET